MDIKQTIWLASFFIVLSIKILDFLIPYLIKRNIENKLYRQRVLDDNVELAKMIKDKNGP